MLLLYVYAAIALAYLAGGLLTCIAFVVLILRERRGITFEDLTFLAKVFVAWPAAVGMGMVFGLITIAQRWHFAQEAKAARKAKLDAQSKPPDKPSIAHPDSRRPRC